MILAKTKKKIGPRHHGRKMSLKAFEFAKTEDGYHYELSRGYIVVSEVPNFPHMRRVNFIRRLLDHYFVDHPSRIYEICGASDCKVLIPEWESERHPDIAVYFASPSNRKGRTMWRSWFPDLVIEVVSESSHERDYTQKRDEYLSLGVKEYWIVDGELEQVLLLRRGKSTWIEKTLGPQDIIESKLLPGFKLPCRPIFEAGQIRESEE